MKNIKNNMLSLKTLKQELDTLKAANAVKVSDNDTKPLHNKLMKGSAFTLWLISGIISYAHKLPIVNKLISILSLWYGKTTWWKLLFWLRKIFVIVNAIIGVFVVFKTTGFTSDNILAGFAGIGYNYLEIITSLTKRLFNWFYDFFDNKVIPNNPPSSWWNPYKQLGWYSKPMHNDGIGKMMDLAKSQDFYKSPFNLSINYQSDWYKDWSTWLWIGGAVISVGLIYLGYKLIMDPALFNNYFTGNNISEDITDNAPDVTDYAENNPDIVIFDARSSTESIIERVGSVTNKIVDKINPLNYFSYNTERDRIRQFNEFMIRQNEINTHDERFYPWTEVYPHASWTDKIKLYFFGESAEAYAIRKDKLEYADRVYNALKVSNGQFTEVGGLTPMPYIASSLGLGNITPFPLNSIWDQVLEVNLHNKLKAISPTPKTIPVLDLPDVNDWKKHVREAVVEKYNNDNNEVTNWTYASKVASSSKVKVEDISTALQSKNRFEVLSETTK